MDFFFVRHGKTKWNLEGKYQGANGDSPLLKDSHEDIKKLATYFKGKKITRIYTSPLQRAQTTANELNEQLEESVEVVTDDRLKEFDLGGMEGKFFKDVESKYPDLIDAFRNHPEKYDPSVIHGETFESVIKRTNELINEICQQGEMEDNYIIVSHGAALVAMIQSLLKVELRDMRKRGGLANTSVTRLRTKDYGENFELIEWNNTEFLHKKTKTSDVI